MARRTANLISAYRLAEGKFNNTEVHLEDGTIRIARPYGCASLEQRIVWAWRVFTGKCDCLIWPGQGDE